MSSERFAHYWIYIFGSNYFKVLCLTFFFFSDLHNLHLTGTLRHTANPTSPFRVNNIVQDMLSAMTISGMGASTVSVGVGDIKDGTERVGEETGMATSEIGAKDVSVGAVKDGKERVGDKSTNMDKQRFAPLKRSSRRKLAKKE